MNTLTPFAPSLSKTIRTSASQFGNARSLAPANKPTTPRNGLRLTVTQAERMLTQAIAPTATAFMLPISRGRATRQQIESAVLSLLFGTIAITFGFLMTA